MLLCFARAKMKHNKKVPCFVHYLFQFYAGCEQQSRHTKKQSNNMENKKVSDKTFIFISQVF